MDEGPLALASAVVLAKANSYGIINSPGLDSMLLLHLSYPIFHKNYYLEKGRRHPDTFRCGIELD